MNKLNIQEYLNTHSLEDLTKEFGIIVGEYDDRVILNYHQINSYKHKFNPIVMECRSLILSKPDYKVLSRSFDRFWNYGEDPKTDEFDIKEATCWEKVDGSILSIYFDGNEWCCSTKKMAFAEGETSLGNTYIDLFKTAIGNRNLNSAFGSLNKDWTYIFELVSPETRIVMRYDKPMVYILSIRDKITGEYIKYHHINNLKMFIDVHYPKVYKFNSFEEIMKSMNELDILEEGYVCQIDNWRVKVKNPSYLAIAHLREDGILSTRRIIDLIYLRNHEEYLISFPEDRVYFEKYINAYERMLGAIDICWILCKDIKNQKEFALKVNKTGVGSIMFNIRKGKKIEDILNNLTKNAKIRIIESFIK